MDSNEQIFKINGKNYKCRFMYGYNDHYYGVVYDDSNGRFLGEIVDIRKGDCDTQQRVVEFVNQAVMR